MFYRIPSIYNKVSESFILFHNKTNIAINAAITPITIVIGPPKIPNTVTSPVIAFLINPILPNNNWNIAVTNFIGPFNDVIALLNTKVPVLAQPNLVTNATNLAANGPKSPLPLILEQLKI